MSIRELLTVAFVMEPDERPMTKCMGQPLSECIVDAITHLAMRNAPNPEKSYVFALSPPLWANYIKELGARAVFTRFQDWNSIVIPGMRWISENHVIGDPAVPVYQVLVFSLPGEDYVGWVDP